MKAKTSQEVMNNRPASGILDRTLAVEYKVIVRANFFPLCFSFFSLICLGVFFFFSLRYFVNYAPLLCAVCKFRYSLLPRPYFIAVFYGAISVRSFRRSRFFPRWP